MVRRKLIAMLMAGTIASLALAGCGGASNTPANTASSNTGNASSEASGDTASSDPAAAAGTHLNAALFWFGTSLDPHTEYDGWTTSRVGITETLVTVDENYELQPLLAESWEQPDETTWIMHIRDGVTFHNGKTVDGEAVKKSFERAMELQERAVTSSHIESIEADGQDVIFHMKDLNAAFPAAISEPLFSVIDVDAGTDFASAPVATGPFMVREFEVDTVIEMERHDGYWNGASPIETVTVRHIADDSTRSLAVQSGEIDLAQRISDTELQVMKDDPKYQIFTTLGARTRLIMFNYMNDFLADVNVRKAIAASINYDLLVKTLGESVGVAGAPYPSSAPYGYDELDRQTYNPEEAKRLLEESGFSDSDGDGIVEKDGEALSLTMNYSYANYTVMLEAVQAMAKECGIDLQLNLVDSTMEMTQGKAPFDIVVTNWQTLSTGDPQWMIDSQYKTGAANNGGHYSNPDLDALADKLANTTDLEERRKITIDIENILLEDCVSVYMVGETNFLVANDKVSGVTPYPIDYYFLDNKVAIGD